jgi:hypothetical protein
LATNKRREQRLQSLMLDRLVFKYERQVAREIQKAMLSVKVNDQLSFDVAERLHSERLNKIMGKMWLDSANEMTERLFGENKKQLLTAFAPTVTTNAIMNDYVRIYGASKVTRIARTTMDSVRGVISTGIDEGLSEINIAKLIKDKASSIGISRAQTIARTETHTAANYAAHEAVASTGIDMRREWVSAEDDRARDSHLEANGQIVSMLEPFVVDGEDLMYPADPSGSAENVINCRCAVVYVPAEEVATAIVEAPPPPVDQTTQKFESGFGQETDQFWYGAPSMTQLALAVKAKPNSIKFDENRGLYNTRTKQIISPKSKRTFTHEYAHFIDFQANENINQITRAPISYTRGLHKDLLEDAKAIGLRGNIEKRNDIIRAFRAKHYTATQVPSEKIPNYVRTKYVKKTEEVSSLSDIYDAATKGIWFESGAGAGHGKRYYKFEDNIATETFAQMVVLYEKPEWDEVKAVFPRAAAKFEQIVQEIKDAK